MDEINRQIRVVDLAAVKYGILLEKKQESTRTAQLLVAVKNRLHKLSLSVDAQDEATSGALAESLSEAMAYLREKLLSVTGGARVLPMVEAMLLGRPTEPVVLPVEQVTESPLASVNPPIQRLPFEVLSAIFLHVYELEREEHDRRLSRLSPLVSRMDRRRIAHFNSPKAVSHVNRKFREVALATGNLWTDIRLRDGMLGDRMKTCLERAGACLLDVQIDFPAAPSTHVANALSEAVGPLLPPSRWRSFSVLYRDRATLDAILNFCRDPAPNLQTLSLVNGQTSAILEDVEPAPDLFSAPSLDQVTIVGIPVPWSHENFTRLKILELQWQPMPMKPTAAQWIKLLRSSPALEKLLVIGSGPYVPENFDPARRPEVEVVRLESLRELQLSCLRPNALQYLVQTIVSPSLQSFELNGVLGNVAYYEALELLATAKYPNLGRLKVTWSTFEPDMFLRILRAFSGVRELELNGSDGYLSSLTADDAAPSSLILPQLRRLTVTNHSAADVLAFTEQRERLGARVEEVVVDEFEEMEAKETLEQWAAGPEPGTG